jgi:hypothetical protein
MYQLNRVLLLKKKKGISPTMDQRDNRSSQRLMRDQWLLVTEMKEKDMITLKERLRETEPLNLLIKWKVEIKKD